jgi:hypothetical protein
MGNNHTKLSTDTKSTIMKNTHFLAQILTLPGEGGTLMPIQGPINGANTTYVFTDTTIGTLINRVVPFVIAFAGIGLLLVIISGGFSLLTSAGDAKKMQSGKQQITNGVIGFIIILTAYWLVQIAGNVLGIGKIDTVFK